MFWRSEKMRKRKKSKKFKIQSMIECPKRSSFKADTRKTRNALVCTIRILTKILGGRNTKRVRTSNFPFPAERAQIRAELICPNLGVTSSCSTQASVMICETSILQKPTHPGIEFNKLHVSLLR
jgi:hypothetical protein